MILNTISLQLRRALGCSNELRPVEALSELTDEVSADIQPGERTAHGQTDLQQIAKEDSAD